MRIEPVDRDAPLDFLRTAYQPADWVAVFLKSYETGQTKQRVGPVTWVADERFQAWLRWLNLQHWNIYVSCNAIRSDARTRTKDAINAIRHVFIDADEDGAETLARINSRSDLPSPSYVIESSPNRVHVLWKVEQFTKTGVEQLQKYFARVLGTDPAATACTQTTRLPGFRNHKCGGHVVTIEYRDRTSVYPPTAFPAPRVTATREAVVPRPRPLPSDRLERARRYLKTMPPAISGLHGDLHTFRVCCRMVRGFALADADALAVLAEWNAGCQPPWSDRDLLEKVRRARRYGREPIGGLLSNLTGVM